MNQLVSPTKTALAVGVFVGGLHLVWSILVALGWAQALINFIFWAHMISMTLVVSAFDATAAVTLIVITSIIGYVLGYISALIWNRIHRA